MKAIFCATLVYISAHAQIVDTSFRIGSGADAPIFAMVQQSDGKILVGGAFSSFNGVSRTNLARLNTDGSLDETFVPVLSPSWIRSIALDGSGHVLVAGDWPSSARRLNTDGAVDGSFQGYGGLDANWIGIDSKNRIIVAGNGNTGFPPIVRLNFDGSIDWTFYGGSKKPSDYGVSTVAFRPDGHLIIGGRFGYVNGVFWPGLAELDESGRLVPRFAFPDQREQHGIDTLLTQPDGKLVAGGYLSQGVVRYLTNGSLDTNFISPYLTRGFSLNGIVTALARQNDGRILIGGEFSAINDGEVVNFARLLRDGSFDPEFLLLPPPNNAITAIQLQADGAILIAGRFGEVGGVAQSGIARILPNFNHDRIPPLTIKRSRKNRLVVSWQSSDVNWTLQVSKRRRTPIWSDVLDDPVLIDGRMFVTNRVADGKVFRLILE